MRLQRFVFIFFFLFSFCAAFAQQAGGAGEMTFAQFKAQLAQEKETSVNAFLSENLANFSPEQKESFRVRANAAWDRTIEELWAARSSARTQEELDRKVKEINDKLTRSLNAAFFSLELPAIKETYGEDAERESRALIANFEAGSLTADQFQAQWRSSWTDISAAVMKRGLRRWSRLMAPGRRGSCKI